MDAEYGLHFHSTIIGLEGQSTLLKRTIILFVGMVSSVTDKGERIQSLKKCFCPI